MRLEHAASEILDSIKRISSTYGFSAEKLMGAFDCDEDC